MSDISLIPQNLIKGLESDLNGKVNSEYVDSRITSIMDTNGKYGIVESAGDFIKFADGTLICYHYYNGIPNNSNVTITFPQPFIYNPRVTVGQSNSDINAFYHNHICIAALSATSVTLSNRRFHSDLQYSLNVQWMAIGRWK